MLLVHAIAGHDNLRPVLDRQLDRGPQFSAQARPCHGKQVLGGMARRHAKVAVGGAEGEQAFVALIDQHRGGRIGLHDKAATEIRQGVLA